MTCESNQFADGAGGAGGDGGLGAGGDGAGGDGAGGDGVFQLSNWPLRATAPALFMTSDCFLRPYSETSGPLARCAKSFSFFPTLTKIYSLRACPPPLARLLNERVSFPFFMSTTIELT